MNTGPMLETLRSIEFLRDLESEHLETLSGMAKEVTFEEDEIIFREGSIGEQVYLIQQGQVAIEVYSSGRTGTIILTVGPGQLLGWSSFFSGKHKTAKSRAVTPTRAIAIDAPKLRAACEADHDLGYLLGWRVAEVIANRLKATRMQLLDIYTA
jgi:CRP-like cAMP-binding protein